MQHIKRSRDKTFNNLVVAESLELTNGAKGYLTLRPYIEIGKIAQNTKPTIVGRGISKGYSFPVYNDDDEEIFMCTCVPRRWDGKSDPVLVLPVHIDTANTDKKFKIQASWEHYDPDNDIVPATYNDVEIEVDLTGVVAQYQSFKMEFVCDYDIDDEGDLLEYYQRLCIRVRRIAASSAEMAGEVVVGPPVVKFLRNKM